jgi:hypothetical protein
MQKSKKDLTGSKLIAFALIFSILLVSFVAMGISAEAGGKKATEVTLGVRVEIEVEEELFAEVTNNLSETEEEIEEESTINFLSRVVNYERIERAAPTFNDERLKDRSIAVGNWLLLTTEINGVPLTVAQVAGLIGNMVEESGVQSAVVQSTCPFVDGRNVSEITNDEIRLWEESGNCAIGIIQWTDTRRTALIDFADEHEAHWSDINIQLQFLQMELEGFEGKYLLTPTEDISYCESSTEHYFNMMWADIIDYETVCTDIEEEVTVCDEDGICYQAVRLNTFCETQQNFELTLEASEDFAFIWHNRFIRSQFACNRYSSSQFSRESHAILIAAWLMDEEYAMFGIRIYVMNEMALLAMASSWSFEQRRNASVSSSCMTNVGCGRSQSTETYQEVGQNIGLDIYASCCRFVAAMVRGSGVDEEYPWGGTSNQLSYVINSPRWQEVSCVDREAGDVMLVQGHTAVFLGDGGGEFSQEMIAHASLSAYNQQTARQTPFGGCRSTVWHGQTVRWFRPVN